MANVIKYNTGSVPANAIKSGNFDIGVNFGGYGSTSATNYYNGKTPNVSGYTIYVANGISSPILYAAANDAELIGLSNQLGGSGNTTIGQALTYFRSSSTMTCVNVDYPNIVTSGLVLNLDAGFTPSYPRTGTSWFDISGNANTGTLVNGPTYSSDGGGSISFDGTDDYISLPINSSFNTPSITFEVWANLNSTASRHILMLNWQGNSLEVNADRSVVMFNYSSAGQVGASTSASIFNWGSWTHFVGVYDNSSQSLKTYINGVLQATTTSVPSTIYSVGVHKIAGTDYSLGILGNVAAARHYNRALSATEILQNYYAGLQRFIPTAGLVLYLDGNNTNTQVITPTVANDISGNNNTGTLINGVTLARDGQRSFSFDGTDDYLNVTHNTSQNLTSQGTISAWINPAVLTQGWYANIVGKNTGGSVNQQSYTLSWRQVSGVLFGQICNGSGTYNEVYGSFPTVANVWYNIVFTWNGSQLVMYNNGVAVGTTTQTINNQILSTDITIGGYTYKGAGGSDEYFNGKIGQVRIYNIGLTATQVSTIYNATKSRYGL
jgi:hypothetical protein